MNLTSAPDLRVLSSNEQGKRRLTNQSHALSMNYLFSDFKFSSISTFKDLEEKNFYDGDVSKSPFFAYGINYISKEYSQEFRLSKNTENNNYLLGVYFDDIDGYRNNTANGAPFQKFGVKSNTMSIFTNNDFLLDNDFTLSLGARIDKDNIEMSDDISKTKDSNSYTNTSPKVSLKYKPQNDFMTYATISKGYKSGNYYAFAPNPNDRWYDKESLINYELGFKYAIQKDLMLAFSLFYMDIKNKQVSTNISPNVGQIDNAASSESKGFEVDINYEVFEGLNLYSSLGFNKTEFKEFKDTQGDYQGNRNPFSPKYTYSLGAKYRVFNGFFANIDLKGQSDMFADKQNLIKTNSYHIINTKLGYEQDDYEFYLYANNIANKKHDINWGTYSFPSSPREIGIKLRYRF